MCWSIAKAGADAHGRRCTNNPWVGEERTATGQAKRILGAATAETRATLAALPAEYRRGSVDERAAMAAASTCPELLAVAVGDRTRVRRGAAMSPALPVELQERLAASTDIPSRIALASDPSIDPATAHTLAGDPFAAVRVAAASNPATASEDLVVLRGGSPAVGHAAAVALRERGLVTDAELAADANPGVRRVAAEASDDLGVRAILARDVDADVRLALVHRHSADVEFLLTYAHDRSPAVRAFAMEAAAAAIVPAESLFAA